MADITSSLNPTAAITADGLPVNEKGILGKDDFMTLLLTQLQNQDPTSPTDAGEILTQTSQLASLEAAANTNSALEQLTKQLDTSVTKSNQFATVSAIGKTADLGSSSIILKEGSKAKFEVYFPNDIETGTLEIKDSKGNVIRSINLETSAAGVQQFTWDGTDVAGNEAKAGEYSIEATYTDSNGDTYDTQLGYYPVSSVRFDNGETFLKLGSSYIPLSDIKEIF